MLEALYPDRIDLGIGRAPGADQVTAAALRGVSPYVTVEQFPDHLQTILSLLSDGASAHLKATPVPETQPQSRTR
jgi:alkanesulfonate monooxygenase SsuD/methylene tetrahydromethanopterin reductase-like flavin-dependent oxidoreductase (luciferase family)